MTTASLSTVQTLEAPRVNENASTRIMPQSVEAELRLGSTAGMSSTIADLSDAWKLYAVHTGVFGSVFDPSDWPEHELSVNTMRYQGSFGLVRFYLTQSRPSEPPLSSANWTVTGSPAETYGHYWASVFEAVNIDPITAHRLARVHVTDSREQALAEIRRRLDNARAAFAQRSPQDVVTELTDQLGAGQLVTARALNVTPTAVRKWRRGEPARPEHRDRLSQLAALFRLLIEVGLHDPAGWIDIPISGESTLTPLDLFTGGRADLVVLLGAGLADPQETLDAFHPTWRSTFVPDHEYEVVTLADGSRSVVPRREAKR